MDCDNLQLAVEEANQNLLAKLSQQEKGKHEIEQIEAQIMKTQIEIYSMNKAMEQLKAEKIVLEAQLGIDGPTDAVNASPATKQATDFNEVIGRDASKSTGSTGGDAIHGPMTFDEALVDDEKWSKAQEEWGAEKNKFVAEVLNFNDKYAYGSGTVFKETLKKVDDKVGEVHNDLQKYQDMIDERRFGNQWCYEVRELVTLLSELTKLKEFVEHKRRVAFEYDELKGTYFK